MINELRGAYSVNNPHLSPTRTKPESVREVLKTSECYKTKPRILAFMGASGSGKDLAIEILTSLPGRRTVAKKLELSEPVSIRIVSKVTDRPARDTEVTKIPVSEEDFTNLQRAGKLIGEYQLRSNGCRYAYRMEDLTQTCKEEFLVAEPSILHILELKEKFGDQIHCTFLTSSRGYRERLLKKRGTESPAEIIKRLDEGDGQTFVALHLAGKSADFISQFVSPEIAADFQKLLSSSPDTWKQQGYLLGLREKIGPELVDILENVITHKGKVVDELINIDRFQTFIDDIVILDDKFITDNPYQAGLFSESIIDTATRMLLNSENRIYSVDQTADANVICNLVVPESARSVDTIFGIPYKQIIASVSMNQENRVMKLPNGREADGKTNVHWISYYEDRQRVFGMVISDPDNPDALVSFRAIKPDDSQEALIEFQIHLSPIERLTDRHTVQMAFMSQALKLCEALGIQKFHFAEHFDLVDEQDNVIGLIPRSAAHAENRFIHRAASILIWRWNYNDKKQTNEKQLFMVRRSKNKKLNPGIWQAAPSGHLLPGETYPEGARRELREEIGSEFARQVKAIQPVMAVRAYAGESKSPSAQKENFYFFLANVDKEASKLINTNYEADGAAWMDIDTIRQMLLEDPTQFRDAFRLAFEAIDWDMVTEADQKSVILRKS